MKFTEEYPVAINYDGWRVDRFLTQQLKRATRAKVARIIKAAARLRRADGTEISPVKPGALVRVGDVVLIDRVERADPATPSLDTVEVLHAGAELVVLSKPPGMLVHRTAHEATRTVDAFLAERFAGERVESVHRIDRDTSGVLVCGRGLDAIRALTVLFGASEPAKVYRVVVSDPDGRWGPAGADTEATTRTFDQPLGFEVGSSVEIRVGHGEWDCATHARALRRSGDLAELEARIDRGRQHQIRAHLSLFGTPVLGDKLYAMGNPFFEEWIADAGRDDLVARLPTRWHCLHAARLELQWGGAQFLFEAPLPEHWPM